jgi:hypothetical protein
MCAIVVRRNDKGSFATKLMDFLRSREILY